MSTDTLGKRKSRDEDTHESTGHGSTLFVSNLPYDATSTDLQTAFSDIAPVRSAFVVLEHGTGTSKGVGYVSFSIKEDAQMAFDTITADGIALNGRKLRVQWADSKPKIKAKDRPEADVVKKEIKKRTVASSSGQNVNDPLAIRTIIVSGLPSSIDQKILWKKFRKLSGAEKVEWPAKTPGGEDPSTAHVLFTTSSLAQEAVGKLHAHVFKSSLLSVTLKKRLDNLSKAPAKKTISVALPSRASRLIVRNLPFDITEQDLRAIFLSYGPIHSIHMPLANADDVNPDVDADTKPSPLKTTRSKGFAFVWMLSKKDAETALEKCNGLKVTVGMANDIVSDKQKRKKQKREEKKRSQTNTAEDGEERETVELPEQSGSKSKERVIAVDWALSKEKWEEEKAKFEEAGEDPEEDVEMSEPERSENGAEEASADSEDEQLGLHDDSNDEDGDSEVDDGDDEVECDSDDESPKKPQLPHTDTGTTLFIRNIPYTATEDELRTLFRAFGPLRYARITVDPETERSRGTGFACFWNKEDADKVIAQSEILRSETMGNQPQPAKNPFVLPSILTPDPSASVAKNLVLHGRTLDVVRAVTRDQADKLKEEGERSREKADKRNIYLLREGVILPNTPAAERMPPAELEKRTNSFNARRTMLRSNPSLYVSKTRLSIRQIPLFVTERVIKRLAIHSVREFNAEVKKGLRAGLSPDELIEPAKGDEHDAKKDIKGEGNGKPRSKSERLTSVQQAKIVRQADRVDPVTGKGRSRGYGFVEMHKHADALRVLRWANNNPDVGTLLDKWWKEELGDLLKKEKTSESRDEARIKRIKNEMEAPSKPPKGALIVELSIENVQVVHRRAAQREKVPVVKPHKPCGNKLAQGKAEEPPSKKRRVSSDPAKLASTEQKPGKLLGSVIGRKRRARKAGKTAD
ncbi:hypothetical protein PAXRUDRAFT_823683 [Paxillus rubicundulus Ve08.2h10]|uniref:RRM domain-containing protein n=1 Tax=Paxillus rubicundulus Ve08.2h10 TaxID=930991 RepID=A0A0D0DVA6_9AGAM|nr:hypothetical protein PAXRUDRAFT_823683 [Paxillus rubicundulus Ve08.2h10]